MNVSGPSGTGGTSGMSGVGAVSANTWSGASRREGGPGAVGRMQSAIGAASQLLNLSPSELVSQLGSGQSLATVAQSQGVSRDRLLGAVTKAVASAVPQGGTPLNAELLAKISGRIADSTQVPRSFLTRSLG